MLESDGSMSKINSTIGSNFMIGKFDTKQITYQLVLKSPEDQQFYHQFSRGDVVEAVHLHGAYDKNSEEGAEEPLPFSVITPPEKKHNE